MSEVIRLIFDGPPGPTAGRFVEAENEAGASICVGEWKEHRNIDGWWELVIDLADGRLYAVAPSLLAALQSGMRHSSGCYHIDAGTLEAAVASAAAPGTHAAPKTAAELERVREINAELVGHLRAVRGFIQLIASRDDVPAEIKALAEEHWRITEADEALAKHARAETSQQPTTTDYAEATMGTVEDPVAEMRERAAQCAWSFLGDALMDCNVRTLDIPRLLAERIKSLPLVAEHARAETSDA